MTQTTLIEFPCNFPVKIIGTNSDAFLNDIKAIIEKHFPDFNYENLTQKPSEKNNYLAITATVPVNSQEMLDAFYRDLTKNPDVKMVL